MANIITTVCYLIGFITVFATEEQHQQMRGIALILAAIYMTTL